MLINPQEDFWNPAELGIAEEEIKKVKNGKFVLLSFPESYGHYTFFQAAAWQKYFAEFLREDGEVCRTSLKLFPKRRELLALNPRMSD